MLYHIGIIMLEIHDGRRRLRRRRRRRLSVSRKVNIWSIGIGPGRAAGIRRRQRPTTTVGTTSYTRRQYNNNNNAVCRTFSVSPWKTYTNLLTQTNTTHCQ